MAKFVMMDLTWHKYWMLEVIELWYNKKNHYYWKCKCDCGTNCYADVTKLRHNRYPPSCGCMKWKRITEAKTEHWMSWDRFWKIYHSMKQRCSNPKTTGYQYYWWKWIRVCERWLWKGYMNFKEDMYESYLKHVAEHWEKQTQIDRENNNWNYCKENCKRSTWSEQQSNKRSNVNVEYEWEMITMSQLSRELWLNYQTVFERYTKYKEWTLPKEKMFYKWSLKTFNH